MSSMFNGFGDFDFTGIEDDESAPVTWPSPGSATLVIEDKCEALFFSAEWQLQGSVNGQIIDESNKVGHPHDQEFTKRWARLFIRQNVDKLRRLGVDVEKTYVQWDGDLDDL